MMDILERKESLRKKLLERLLSLTREETERRSKNVEKIISSLSIYKQAKVIMVYYPLKGEANLLGIVREAFDNKEVCFPVIDSKSKNLIPYSVRDLKKDFVRGPCGVMQPDTKRTKPVSVEDIDLILVPGIAFDNGKHRMGRGGGFYDKFIKTLNGHTKTVGVAFDFQVLKNLPVRIPQDEKVDFIVTETECF